MFCRTIKCDITLRFKNTSEHLSPYKQTRFYESYRELSYCIAVVENIFLFIRKNVYTRIAYCSVKARFGHPPSKLTHLKISWQVEVFRSAQSFTCPDKNPSIQYFFWKFLFLQFNKLFTGGCCIELVSLLCSKLGSFNETPTKCDTNDKLAHDVMAL